MKQLLALLFFLHVGFLRAADFCRTDYFQAKDERAQVEQVQQELEELPPIVLDVSSPRESFRKLLEDIKELHPDFLKMQMLEQLVESGEVSVEDARQYIEAFEHEMASKSQELVQKFKNGTITSQERKLLEGHRILNRKSNRLRQRLEEIKEEQEQGEEQQSKEQSQGREYENSDKDQKEDSKSEEEREGEQKDSEDSKPDEQKESQKRESKEQKSREQGPDSQKDKDDQERDRDSSEEQEAKDSEQESELDKKIEEVRKKIQEKIKEEQERQKQSQEKRSQEKKKDQKKNKSEQKDSEKQEGDKEKSEQRQEEQKDSEEQSGQEIDQEQQSGEKQESQGKESKEEGQEGEGQEGDGQGGKPSQGQQGKPTGKESQGNQQGKEEGQEGDQDGQPGESPSKGKSKGKTRSDKKNQGSESQSESNEDGQGQSSDGNSGGIAQKLADYFKDLLEGKEESKEGDSKSEETDTDKPERDLKEKDQKLSAEQEAKRKAQEERRRRQEDERRKKAQEQKTKTEEARSRPSQQNLNAMNDMQKAEFLKNYMDQLWAETLRNYTEYTKLMSSLTHFRSVADSLVSQYSGFSFLAQYAQRAHKIYELLDSSQIQYKNLDHLGVSVIGEETGAKVLRKLRFIITLFESLKEVSSLTSEEDMVLNRAYEIYAQRKMGSQNYERELGKAIISQMVGPLSRLDLQKRFPSSDPREEYDWKALVHAVKSGELNDLIGFSRVKSYLNMFNRRTFKPKKQITYSGPKVPINESEPQLDMADDLDRAPYFYRDGTHPRDDLLRLISGDMLENIYPDQQLRNNPKTKIPKVVTVVVFDISGSMGGDKDSVRNALIASYLDKTQIDVITGRAEHVYYFIPFDTRPHATERVEGFQRAKEYFNRFRQYPRSAGGGTNITETLVEVYESIARHQKEGGELDYANILFLTDGEANLDLRRIETSRKKISPDVDIILNAITLGKKNAQVAALAKENGGSGEGSLGRVFHQHIDSAQLQGLLNHKEKIEHLEKIAEDFDPESDFNFRRDLLLRLKNEITRLSAQREMKDRSDAYLATRLTRELEKPSGNPEAALQFPMTVFLSTVDGPISEGWVFGHKGEVLQQYLEDLSKIYQTTPDQILEMLDNNIRKKLLTWLKKS